MEGEVNGGVVEDDAGDLAIGVEDDEACVVVVGDASGGFDRAVGDDEVEVEVVGLAVEEGVADDAADEVGLWGEVFEGEGPAIGVEGGLFEAGLVHGGETDHGVLGALAGDG